LIFFKEDERNKYFRKKIISPFGIVVNVFIDLYIPLLQADLIFALHYPLTLEYVKRVGLVLFTPLWILISKTKFEPSTA
jgi:hypothetical protein